MSRSWIVSIPIAGAMHIEVGAKTRERAIELAWEEFQRDGADSFEVEWEAMECIAEGNVCHAPHSHIEATAVPPKRPAP